MDILFKQIGSRLTFEAFIFGLACLVGSFGGWYYVMRRNRVAALS